MNIDYGALSLIPPCVAIILAIWKRQVIVSLFLGIWAGATIIAEYNPAIGLLDTCSVYIVEKSLADSWNIGIIVFCLSIGGMIGVISKTGGTVAIAEKLVIRAKSVRSTQLSAAIMGVAIFFDDYANSMIVGNTMRPITDRHRISREKLAYIVDSTAAPVSSMAPVSTWIAMELGLIVASLEASDIHANSMVVFIQTIPYRFYSIFALIMVFTVIIMKRDFSKMLIAERRAASTGKVFDDNAKPMIAEDRDLYPDENIKGSIWHALIPIISFTILTVFGLWYNGHESGMSLRDSIGNADASVVLTWASIICSIIAIILAISTKKLTLSAAVDSWITGAKSMMTAVIILCLAFALKSVISDMQLAEWLIKVSQNILAGQFLPLLTFLIAMIIAFATGTSWGTNSILMPIVIPVAASISGADASVTPLIIASIGAVLTGAVFGDHCSPISDTTILSSMASGSDHIDHIKTQVPYAVLVAAIAAVVGFIPAGYDFPVWICLIAGFIFIIASVRIFGKKL